MRQDMAHIVALDARILMVTYNSDNVCRDMGMAANLSACSCAGCYKIRLKI